MKIRFTKEEKFIAKLVVIVLAGLSIRGWINFGYEEAIKNAQLVSVNENTQSEYIISFKGENHLYQGNWEEKYQSSSDYIK